MNMVELGSILHLTKGKKPVHQSDSAQDGYLPYVDIKAFETGQINSFTDGEKCIPCKAGDVLIVCDGARSGLVGRAMTGYVGSTLAKVTAEGLNNDYLFYFIQGKYALLNTKMKGTGTPHLNVEELKKQKLVIPEKEEQERIVAKIEELFSEFDKTEETLRLTQIQLDLYKQSVLKYAFTIESNSISLEQACIRIFDGPFGSHLKSSDYIADGIRVVRLENIKDGWFDTSKSSFVSESKYETIKSHTVISGDLIMSTFLSDKVKVCKLPADIPFAVNKADCVGIRLKKGFSADFIQYFLLSRYVYRQLINNVHGATRPRVNTTQIKEISIPNIPLEQQVAIATNIEANLSICNNIEATIQQTQRQIESLRQSILKKAFEGKLI